MKLFASDTLKTICSCATPLHLFCKNNKKTEEKQSAALAVLCFLAMLYSALISPRTKLPRMPLMNFTVSGVSYFLAISTASLTATRVGMSLR